MIWAGWGREETTPFLQVIRISVIMVATSPTIISAAGKEREEDSKKLPLDKDRLISYPLEGLPRQPRTESKCELNISCEFHNKIGYYLS